MNNVRSALMIYTCTYYDIIFMNSFLVQGTHRWSQGWGSLIAKVLRTRNLAGLDVDRVTCAVPPSATIRCSDVESCCCSWSIHVTVVIGYFVNLLFLSLSLTVTRTVVGALFCSLSPFLWYNLARPEGRTPALHRRGEHADSR